MPIDHAAKRVLGTSQRPFRVAILLEARIVAVADISAIGAIQRQFRDIPSELLMPGRWRRSRCPSGEGSIDHPPMDDATEPANGRATLIVVPTPGRDSTVIA